MGAAEAGSHLFEDVQVFVAEADNVGRDVVILVNQQLQEQWHLGLHRLQRLHRLLRVPGFDQFGPAEHQTLTHPVYQARELGQEVHVLLLMGQEVGH